MARVAVNGCGRQSVVDGPNEKLRRGRAAAANMIPTTTGATKATAKALPSYEGRFAGVAVRASNGPGSSLDGECASALMTNPHPEEPC